MGAAASKLIIRPLKNWNVENRAHKIISKAKPVAAPTYDTTQKQIELVNKLEPDYKETAEKKDLNLDEYLKKVYVTSNTTEAPEIGTRYDPEKPLPKDRLIPKPFEYGFYETDEITPGRVSLRQALEFIGHYNKEPEKYTVEFIATEYKLEPKVVENILEYFKVYAVYEIVSDDHNKDAVAKSMPLSLRSGITVPHTEKKKKIKSEPTKPTDTIRRLE